MDNLMHQIWLIVWSPEGALFAFAMFYVFVWEKHRQPDKPVPPRRALVEDEPQVKRVITSSTPRTATGRALAARAKREGWSNWERLVQFVIPAIENEAIQLASKEEQGTADDSSRPS